MNKVNHIGIIVDGNGRWAKERDKKRSEGHKAGAENLEKIIHYISHENLANYLSLYVFSTENFKRSKEEVDYLMNLFLRWFKKCKESYQNENIKILFSSHKEFLNQDVIKAMDELEKATKDNTGLVVNFCLSYGGKQEIIDATKKIVSDVVNKELDVDNLNEDTFQKYLYKALPDVDLLIRTSGEKRISNFMLWQTAYAEIYFSKTYFPDFTPDCLDEALKDYEKRERRFGSIK